jgi:hypothetical protein
VASKADAEIKRLKAELAEKTAEIERLTPRLPTEADILQQRIDDADWNAMRVAFDLDNEPLKTNRANCHEMRCNGEIQRVQYGACGCCLVDIYRIVRSRGAMKEGERYACRDRCEKMGRNWIVRGGILQVDDKTRSVKKS